LSHGYGTGGSSFACPRGDAVLLRVKVQPRASRTAVVEVLGDRLKISLKAPPVDGKANAELCRFLARKLGVPKSHVEIVRGVSARQKTVAVHGPGLLGRVRALGEAS
jgi:uncharacterized protein (TIGR00251 family)